MAKEKLTTRVSTKGQVILPKTIREHRHWREGTELLVEDRPEGVLLTPAPHFARTRAKDVYKSLAFGGKPKTVEEINAGIAAEAKRRHARDRY